MAQSPSVDAHFEGRAQLRPIYDALLDFSGTLGPFEAQPKKTSIHLARKSAFAGVALRKDALVLTIKAPSDIDDARIAKHEQISPNRWHLEVRMHNPSDIDEDVRVWLTHAYAMSG